MSHASLNSPGMGRRARGKKAPPFMAHADKLLDVGDLQQVVALPEGEDRNEWLSVNTADFYTQINMLYSTVSEFCTDRSCPVMNAGTNFEYHWADGQKYKKATPLSAPEYVKHLMEWIQNSLTDEKVFPSKMGSPFPPTFTQAVKQIFKRLFRVYAHIYHLHFDQVMALGEEAHLNTSFLHFVLFIQEFELVDKREQSPMASLIEVMLKNRTATNS